MCEQACASEDLSIPIVRGKNADCFSNRSALQERPRFTAEGSCTTARPWSGLASTCGFPPYSASSSRPPHARRRDIAAFLPSPSHHDPHQAQGQHLLALDE
eukprot:1147335-Pelagomonas_calceolata.AAC.1